MIRHLGQSLSSRSSITQISRMASNAVEFQSVREWANGKVWVRCTAGEDRMQATVTIQRPACGNSRTFTMNRRQEELVSETLTRLSANIVSKFNKKNKKRKKTEEAAIEPVDWPVEVSLRDCHGEPVNPDLLNHQAWFQGSILKVDNVEYQVEVNPPRISNLTLPRCIMAGYNVHPYIDVEHTELNQCLFNWYRLTSDGKELLVSDQDSFTPAPDDVGRKIKLVILPKFGERVGIPVEAISPGEVTVGPLNCPFEERHKHTVHTSPANGFRVVSYNLLAEVYSNTDYSRDILFEFCPNEYLDYDYRRQLIIKELLGYNSDVICLQEMDKKHYNNYYRPILERHGYMSEMLVKKHKRLPESRASTTETQENDVTRTEGVDEEGKTTLDDVITTSEGSAIFYRKDKFRQVEDYSINLAEVLNMLPLYDDLLKHAELSSLVKEKLLYRSGANLQVKVLESIDNPDLKLCISTTHLYFHPKASVVRLLQAAASLRLLQHVKSIYSTNNMDMPIIYCGDYNSRPREAPAHFVLNGEISAEHNVWNQEEEYVMPGKNLEHQLKLNSACGFPQYTNFTPTFKECLDYIFYDKQLLHVNSVVPFPDLETLAAHRDGIPSPVFPSDHVALVCDFSWRKQSDEK